MNACLTWSGISVTVMGNSLISSATLTKAVPAYVAIMVWLIRVLIIGTFAMEGEHLLSMGARPSSSSYSQATSYSPSRPSIATPRLKPTPFDRNQDMPAPAISSSQRGEPTYHPLGVSACGGDVLGNTRG